MLVPCRWAIRRALLTLIQSSWPATLGSCWQSSRKPRVLFQGCRKTIPIVPKDYKRKNRSQIAR